MNIRLARDELCIYELDVSKLSGCKTFSARLIGQGIDQKKKFAVLDVGGEPMYADTVTGSLFDCDGKHQNNHALKVVDFPKVAARDIPKWLSSTETKKWSGE